MAAFVGLFECADWRETLVVTRVGCGLSLAPFVRALVLPLIFEVERERDRVGRVGRALDAEDEAHGGSGISSGVLGRFRRK